MSRSKTIMARMDRSSGPAGTAFLHDPALNKGTAFSREEREALGLLGLLPPRICSIEEQVQRVLENFRKKSTDLEKYIFLMGLQGRNETLFFRVLQDHIEEMMPIIYTPTVGRACQEYGHIFRTPRGIFISAEDRGRMIPVLRNWPYPGVRIIVVTDGERILGLGDLGANGMGIPVGKLSLYTVCAGVAPSLCLPVTLDVGTENEELLKDPLYIGLPMRRVRGEAYDDFIEEFVTAVQACFPDCLIQFEDFANANAFRLLTEYRNRICTFNDDIQGTAAVALAGLYSALRITRSVLKEQRFLFLGAGEAGLGIADLIVSALTDEGMAADQARSRCWFVDSGGLVVQERSDLSERKRRYAHDHRLVGDLLAAVRLLEPTVMIGVSGKPGMFTREVLEAAAACNERPVVFALSNPTSKAECTAKEAYTWTQGRAVFASGSPFDPVTLYGTTYFPAQGNNAYVFPGVGLGVVACGIRHVTDEMFLAAARALAREVSEADLARGSIYPPLARVKEVSAVIAAAVAEVAYSQELATVPRPKDLPSLISSCMYRPVYQSYI